MFSLQSVLVVILALQLVQARPQPDGSGDGQPMNMGFKTPSQIPCSIKQQIRTAFFNMMSSPTTSVKTFFDNLLSILRSNPETAEIANKLEEIRTKKQQYLTTAKSCFLEAVKDNQTAIDLCNNEFPKLESDDSTFSDKCNAHYDLMHQLSAKDKESLHNCMPKNHAGMGGGNGNNNMMMFKSGGPGMMPSPPNSASSGQPFPGMAFGGLGPMGMGGPQGPGGVAMSGSPAGSPGTGAPAGANNFMNNVNALKTTLRAGGNPCELIQEIMQEVGQYFQEHPGQCPATTDGNNAAGAPAAVAPAS